LKREKASRTAMFFLYITGIIKSNKILRMIVIAVSKTINNNPPTIIDEIALILKILRVMSGQAITRVIKETKRIKIRDATPNKTLKINKLLPSRLNCFHGSLTAALFLTAQSRNMNFPLLLSH